MIRRVGEWRQAMRLATRLAIEMEKARKQSLMQYGLKVEAIAKGHISNQDLRWQELATQTLERKIRKGYSTNILVETSSYFQAITSWVMNDTALIGVRRVAVNSDGEEIANIARVHEYGAGNIPARPLWQPTFEESLEWFGNSDSTPAKIFMKNINRWI